MAIRYANFDLATGLNDGTSEINAWQSWADLFAGESAGDVVYVKRTATRHTESAIINFTLFSTTDSDISIVQGYETVIGDGGMFRTSDNMRLTTGVIVRNMDIVFDSDSVPAVETQKLGIMENCRIVQQGRAGIVCRGSVSPQQNYSSLVNCYLERNTDGGVGGCVMPGTDVGYMDGCELVEGRQNNNTNDSLVSTNNSDAGTTYTNCTLRGPGGSTASRSAMYVRRSSDNNITIRNCSFHGWGGSAIRIENNTVADSTTVIQGCAFEDCDVVIKWGPDPGVGKTFMINNVHAGTITRLSQRGSSDYAPTVTGLGFDEITSCFVDGGAGDFSPTANLLGAAYTMKSGTYIPGARTPSGGGGGGGLAGKDFGLLPVNRTGEIV